MEHLTESDETAELSPTERQRLARLALRLPLSDQWAPPGTFLRSHRDLLDRQIKAADAASVHQQKVDSAQRSKLAAAAYLAGTAAWLKYARPLKLLNERCHAALPG